MLRPIVPLQRETVVPIGEITSDTAYAMVLSYPRCDGAKLERRLRELRRLKIRSLEFKGDKYVSTLHVLGKGCVGIVLIAHLDWKKAALKVRRSDADRSSMHHEVEMLERANAVNVGPKLLGFTRNMLLMQFVEGQLLPEWIHQTVERSRVRKVLADVLQQCWLMDHAGLDHGELSHAPKHIIVDRMNKPFIVDFESASINRRPANVTSVCQFLFLSEIKDEVAEKIGKADRKAVIEALRIYKKQKSPDSFTMVLKSCSL